MSETRRSDQPDAFPMHRLEAFSDGVFAFAVTLLVVSLDVPRSAQELFAAMRDFLGFGICFAFLVLIWISHVRFFRDYPLADRRMVGLNMVLLFVVLLFVYPMKFLFSVLASELLGQHVQQAIGSLDEVRTLMQIYGLGFLALYASKLLMHLHVRSRGEILDLTPKQRLALSGSTRQQAIMIGIAAVSIAIARFTQDDGRYSGCVYLLIAPLLTANGHWTRRLAAGVDKASA